MDALPARELTLLERAIQSFNAGSDPSAGALQRAFVDGKVNVLSASEVHPGGTPDGLRLLGFGGAGSAGSADPGDNGSAAHPESAAHAGDTAHDDDYLAVFTHEDRVPLDLATRFPWMVHTSGENVLGFTGQGITINPGSDPSLAVAVKAGGVQEMRELVGARQAAVDARSARPPHEIESAIASVDRNGMTAASILQFAAVLWPATLVVPSSRPLEGVIDLEACFTFGPDEARTLVAFTDRDQLGDFQAPHLLEIAAGELFHRLPPSAGLFINPQRPDELALSREGLTMMSTLIERPARPDDSARPDGSAASVPPAPPSPEPPPRRGLFGRRRG
jgi:hypothetical protein